MFLFVAIFTLPASAHSISISALCPDDNGTPIAARAWSGGAQGTNPNIKIEYQYAQGNWVSPYINMGIQHFGADNNYEIKATVPITDMSWLSVVATALSPWGDGSPAGTMAYETFDMSTCGSSTSDGIEPEPSRIYRLYAPFVSF